MIAPKFSIKSALIWMLIAGLFMLVVLQAFQGYVWAVSVSVAVLSMLIVFSLHAFAYFLTMLFSIVFIGRRSKAERQGPFATDRLPPQLIQPKSVESE